MICFDLSQSNYDELGLILSLFGACSLHVLVLGQLEAVWAKHDIVDHGEEHRDAEEVLENRSKHGRLCLLFLFYFD